MLLPVCECGDHSVLDVAAHLVDRVGPHVPAALGGWTDETTAGESAGRDATLPVNLATTLGAHSGREAAKQPRSMSAGW